MTYWWLAFADQTRPLGTESIGVSVVEADTIGDAISRSHALGCNPGGEILAVELETLPGPGIVDRALTPEEIGLFGNRTLQS